MFEARIDAIVGELVGHAPLPDSTPDSEPRYALPTSSIQYPAVFSDLLTENRVLSTEYWVPSTDDLTQLFERAEGL